MTEHRARAVIGDQRIKDLLLGLKGFHQGFRRQRGHILLRVIDPGCKVGGQLFQRGFYPADGLCQCPVQRRFCQCRSLPAARRDDLHHGLGLGQAHPPVFQRTAGKLAGCGGGGTRGDQGLQQSVCHGRAAVDRKLDDILPRVAVGCAEKEGYRLIHLPPAQAVVTEQGRVALGLRHRARRICRKKHPARNPVGLRPREADGGNAALPRWGGKGADGGVGQHGGSPPFYRFAGIFVGIIAQAGQKEKELSFKPHLRFVLLLSFPLPIK